MTRKMTLAAAAVFLLTACNPLLVYDEHCPEFENRRWYADNEVVLEPTIETAGVPYRLSLTMRHIYGFQHDVLRVKVNMQSPSGLAEERVCDLTIKSPDGTHMAKCSVDICDLTQEMDVAWTPTETGVYRFAISHLMPHEFVPNVMDIGLMIEKPEK